MPRDDRDELVDALAVTAELTGTELSRAAAKVMAMDMRAYPLEQVLAALTRCRRELRGRLTVAAIIERLDDGRPGPEEAWAMLPKDDGGSVVWTSEMAEAFGVAAPLMHDGDMIAARMAFRETYAALIVRARAEQAPVQWLPSLGHDPTRRAAALEEAVRKGRVGTEHVRGLLPASVNAGEDAHLLGLERAPMPEKVRLQLAEFLGKVSGKTH